MRAGLLRDPIRLEEPGALEKSTYGDNVRAPSTFYERFAQVRGLTVNETLNADRILASEKMRFQMRYDAVVIRITPEWRLHFNSLIFDLSYPIDPDGRRHEIYVIGTRTQMSDVDRG